MLKISSRHSNNSMSFRNSLLTKAHFTYWSSLPPCTSTLMAIPPHTIVFPHVATLRHICIVITTIKSDFPAVSWFAKSTFYFDCNTSTLVFRIYIIWMKTSTATRLSPLGKNEQWMSGVIVWIIVIIVILTFNTKKSSIFNPIVSYSNLLTSNHRYSKLHTWCHSVLHKFPLRKGYHWAVINICRGTPGDIW